MIGMASYWLFKKAPQNIESLEIIFPVPGHSYIPPDRAFALVEKQVKHKQTIITPQEYQKIYEECATVIHLGDESCPVFDWKGSTMDYIRPTGTWHFKFNESKRFILTKSNSGAILVRGEPYYLSDIGAPRSILKKQKQISRMDPQIIEKGVNIKAEKLKDVFNLLTKHYGEDWRSIEELKFYKNIEDVNDLGLIVENDYPLCEPQPVFDEIRV
ncbi:uncharacterized protein LOC129943162 [Eupeodes corollae]|uniref:uncharacterized protein LOC129943162 n=1 Tax=Eupeodes corollae TaxID=290404 RepID=UPI002490B1F1|nr:uncharacterized protein LOC129943162 [Eupeodes corollae]